MNNRRINFENISNARDLGGLRRADGSVIASGLMIRSANMANASEADVEVLRRKYRLSEIIDLRTESEQRQMPDVVIDHAIHWSIPVFDERVVGISHEKNTGKNEILKSLPQMDDLYYMLVTRDSCRKNLGRAAQKVMEHDYARGSILWHCTEGKDRCGLLTVVLLLALYVDRRQIVEDYLVTNEVNEPKAEMYYQKILAAGRTKTEAVAVKNMFLAKEAYLNKAFSSIDEHYSDIDEFLCAGLDIPRAAVEKFRSNVLLQSKSVLSDTL